MNCRVALTRLELWRPAARRSSTPPLQVPLVARPRFTRAVAAPQRCAASRSDSAKEELIKRSLLEALKAVVQLCSLGAGRASDCCRPGDHPFTHRGSTLITSAPAPRSAGAPHRKDPPRLTRVTRRTVSRHVAADILLGQDGRVQRHDHVPLHVERAAFPGCANRRHRYEARRITAEAPVRRALY